MQKKIIIASTLLLCLCLTTVGCNKQNIEDAKKLHEMHDEMVRISETEEFTLIEEYTFHDSSKMQIKEVINFGETAEYCGFKFTVNKLTINNSLVEGLKTLELYDDSILEGALNCNGPNSLGGRLYSTHLLDEYGNRRSGGELIIFEITIENASNVSRTLDFGGAYGYYTDETFLWKDTIQEVYSNISTYDFDEMALHNIKPGEKINKIMILADRMSPIRKDMRLGISLSRLFRQITTSDYVQVKEDIIMDLGLYE
ncbi:MAG: hypothetical protein ACI4E1_04750 [Lachnospira sp.]